MRPLHFKRVDENTTEVWHTEQDRRPLSTQAVQLSVQQLLGPEAFKSFWKQLAEPGSEATLEDPNTDAIANQLELR